MGRLRGQRNAAREKVWPGQDAAAVRKAKRTAELSLEQQANMILYGCPNVDEGVEEPQIVNPYGTSRRPRDSSAIYNEPKQNHSYQREKPTCAQCGRERSWSSAKLCGECYRGNARKKFQEVSGYIDHFISIGAAPQGRQTTGEWATLTAVEPDFVPALLDEIAKVEFQQGTPFVFISAMIDRDRKPLFNGTWGTLMHMFPLKELPERIKQGRKMRNWMRGQHVDSDWTFIKQERKAQEVPVLYRRRRLRSEERLAA